MKGKFITFEGCEGVGKSTQIRWLREFLEKRGIDCVVTREPGGSAIAEKIRGIILDGKNLEMAGVCEVFLYLAARAQHIEDIIKPALERGTAVICDRYIDSTFAYQGYARGLGAEYVESLNRLAIGGCVPDLTVFLDLPPKIAFRRKGGADKSDRLESLDIAFHEKVYDGYLLLAEKYPERIKRVDARGEKPETHRKVLDLVCGCLGIDRQG